MQSRERVDLPPFSSKLDKPMMEMVAGSNVWYQAHVLRSTAAKLRVLFPGAPAAQLSLCAHKLHLHVGGRVEYAATCLADSHSRTSQEDCTVLTKRWLTWH